MQLFFVFLNNYLYIISNQHVKHLTMVITVLVHVNVMEEESVIQLEAVYVMRTGLEIIVKLMLMNVCSQLLAPWDWCV